VSHSSPASERSYAVALVEAGLQTIPSSLARTRKARVVARRYGVEPSSLLLDVSLFYEEIKRMGINPVHARPDIVHMFLIAASYSPLGLSGKLKVFVHTHQGLLIEVAPGTRPPKNYFQFTKLMIQLLEAGKVPEKGRPLITLKTKKVRSPIDLLEQTGSKQLILLDERGRDVECRELWEKTHPPTLFAVGGFSRGTFREEWRAISIDRIRVSPLPLDAWVAADRLIACLERGVGISL